MNCALPLAFSCLQPLRDCRVHHRHRPLRQHVPGARRGPAAAQAGQEDGRREDRAVAAAELKGAKVGIEV